MTPDGGGGGSVAAHVAQQIEARVSPPTKSRTSVRSKAHPKGATAVAQESTAGWPKIAASTATERSSSSSAQGGAGAGSGAAHEAQHSGRRAATAGRPKVDRSESQSKR